MRPYRILLSPEAAEGATTSDPSKASKGDPETAFQKLLDKQNNDGLALARQLWGENFEYRQKNADLRARVPAEGSVTLSGDDAAAWSAYRNIGKPDDVRRAVRERDDYAGKVANYERDQQVAQVARAMGVPPDKTSLLSDLAKARGVEFVPARVKGADGKESDGFACKVGDADPVPFASAFADAADLIQPAKPSPLGTPRRSPDPAPGTGGGVAMNDLQREVVARRSSGNYSI